MALKFIVFFVSLIMAGVLLYLISRIWFGGRRNTYLKLFCASGLVCSVMTLLNGFNLLLSEDIFRMMYPVLMLMLCILPHITLRYTLYLTDSRFANARWVTWTLTILPAFDVIMLLTNPWHHAFISGYDGVRPLSGEYFPVHAVICYVPLLFFIIIFGKYIIQNIRRDRFFCILVFAVYFPIVLNILYTFNLFDVGFDIVPLTFIVLYTAFAIYSIQFRLFDVKTIALTGLFNSLSDLILVVDNAGVLVDVNPSFRSAFPELKIVAERTSAAYIMQYIWSVSTQYSPGNLFDDFELNEASNIINAEISVSAGGESRTYSLVRDIITERGQYGGYIITMTDISSYRLMINEINDQNIRLTEMKNMAESASNAKTLFLANMSHEIRTPMNAIIGMAQIASGTDVHEKRADYIGKINDAARHLLRVINDILDMSKIESSNFELHEDQFDLMKMIDTVSNINRIRADEKNQQLTVSIDKNIPETIIFDELRLSQVLANLISNAVKFTPEGGLVSLAVKLLSQDERSVGIEFTVTDNGIGISPEQQGGLFNAFEQANHDISRKFGGTGLGLAISKKIVELAGGRIAVDSSPGQGSRFSFDILVPYLSSESLCTASDPISVHEEKYDFTGKTILLVEDIEVNREIIIAMMETTGVKIESAENGQIAVDMYTENPEKYDLIFMDIQMPVLDGYDTAKQIRKVPHTLAGMIPIVAMTANAFEDDITKAISAGMNDHIAKPVDQKDLLSITNQYISSIDFFDLASIRD